LFSLFQFFCVLQLSLYGNSCL